MCHSFKRPRPQQKKDLVSGRAGTCSSNNRVQLRCHWLVPSVPLSGGTQPHIVGCHSCTKPTGVREAFRNSSCRMRVAFNGTSRAVNQWSQIGNCPYVCSLSGVTTHVLGLATTDQQRSVLYTPWENLGISYQTTIR